MKKSKKIKQLKRELKALKASNRIGSLVKLAVYTSLALGYWFVSKKMDLPEMPDVQPEQPIN